MLIRTELCACTGTSLLVSHLKCLGPTHFKDNYVRQISWKNGVCSRAYNLSMYHLNKYIPRGWVSGSFDQVQVSIGLITLADSPIGVISLVAITQDSVLPNSSIICSVYSDPAHHASPAPFPICVLRNIERKKKGRKEKKEDC